MCRTLQDAPGHFTPQASKKIIPTVAKSKASEPTTKTHHRTVFIPPSIPLFSRYEEHSKEVLTGGYWNTL